jgi:hypothetical protein
MCTKTGCTLKLNPFNLCMFVQKRLHSKLNLFVIYGCVQKRVTVLCLMYNLFWLYSCVQKRVALFNWINSMYLCVQKLVTLLRRVYFGHVGVQNNGLHPFNICMYVCTKTGYTLNWISTGYIGVCKNGLHSFSAYIKCI